MTSISIPVDDGAALLCIDVDRTAIDGALAALSSLASVTTAITTWCAARGLPPRQLATDARRRLVQHLEVEGLFQTRNAAEHVAAAPGVSRATIDNARRDAAGPRAVLDNQPGRRRGADVPLVAQRPTAAGSTPEARPPVTTTAPWSNPADQAPTRDLGSPGHIGGGNGYPTGMQIDKDQIIELIRSRGDQDKAQQAEAQLPAQVDPEQHMNLLQQLGIDPQELITKLGGGGGLGGLLGG